MTKPFYCRKAFWVSAAGTLSALGAFLAHSTHINWLTGTLLGLAAICGNLGSVIKDEPTDKDEPNA